MYNYFQIFKLVIDGCFEFFLQSTKLLKVGLSISEQKLILKIGQLLHSYPQYLI